MREPTIFWWPGHVKPGVQMEMGATMDLLPTFCALANATPPADRPLDGYDLSALLLGKTDTSPRDRVFYWREEQLYAIRVGAWKAHFITQGCYGIGPKRETHETPRLYQLEQDPSEKYDVSELHPDVIKRLRAAAVEHQQSIRAVGKPVDQTIITRTAVVAVFAKARIRSYPRQTKRPFHEQRSSASVEAFALYPRWRSIVGVAEIVECFAALIEDLDVKRRIAFAPTAK